eukprot:2540898-Amphidinium_carterae.1
MRKVGEPARPIQAPPKSRTLTLVLHERTVRQRHGLCSQHAMWKHRHLGSDRVLRHTCSGAAGTGCVRDDVEVDVVVLGVVEVVVERVLQLSLALVPRVAAQWSEVIVLRVVVEHVVLVPRVATSSRADVEDGVVELYVNEQVFVRA